MDTLEEILKFEKESIIVIGDNLVENYYIDNSPNYNFVIKKTDPDYSILNGSFNVYSQLSKFLFCMQIGFLDEDGTHLIKNKFNACLMQSTLQKITYPSIQYYYKNNNLLFESNLENGYGYETKLDALTDYSLFYDYFKKCSLSEVIIIDYGVGFFENKLSWLKKDDIKSVVLFDGGKNLGLWKGCDVLNIYEKDAYKITGDTNHIEQCSSLKERLSCNNIIIHKDDGIIGDCYGNVFDFNGIDFKYKKSRRGGEEVFVSILSMLYFYKNEITIKDIEFAWKAKVEYFKSSNNILHPIQLNEGKFVKDSRILKDRNFKLIWTNGCFDLLGPHHIELLKFCKSKGDKLVIGLNSDESVRRLKGDDRPIVSFENRAKQLEALEFVDYIVGFNENTPLTVIEQCCPDVIVKGGDYKKENVVGIEVVGEDNVIIFDLIEDHSTTKVIEKIKSL